MDRKIVGGQPQSIDPARVLQARLAPLPLRSRGTVPDTTLADLAAACEARVTALAGALADYDVLADRLAIAAEGRPGGAR